MSRMSGVAAKSACISLKTSGIVSSKSENRSASSITGCLLIQIALDPYVGRAFSIPSVRPH